MKYLDPKADLTFKKVFGEHPDLVISLLNALLPLDKPEEEVQSIEYLPAELVPDNPLRKNSIVDVRCKDARGRQFIVEMQMVWSKEFQNRVLFNASKAYVRQLDKSNDYDLLQPVYSLNLVNDIFEPDMEPYYHYYRMVHYERTDKVIDGLHLIFIELPKFKPHNYSEKKMQVLWLRFLTEISEQTRDVPMTSSGTLSAWNAPSSTARCADTRKAWRKAKQKAWQKARQKWHATSNRWDCPWRPSPKPPASPPKPSRPYDKGIRGHGQNGAACGQVKWIQTKEIHKSYP